MPSSAAIISETRISYSLRSMKKDIFTFVHANGQSIAVRVLPELRPDGKPIIYEAWQRVRRSRSSRLLTERGFELVFEVPILFEYHMERDGYPGTPEELIEEFFKEMKGEVFKHYPRALFA